MRRIYLLIILSSALLSNTILVPSDYPTIQEAINASMDGDSVIVSLDTYPEELYITNSIILIGESGTIIDASGYTNGIVIGLDNEIDGYVDGVEVNGFEIIGDLNTMCGIQVLPGSRNIIIRNNIIHGMESPNYSSIVEASYGILSWGIDADFNPENITISNNEIYNVRAIAISFGSFSNNIVVENNNIHDIIAVNNLNNLIPGLDFSVGINAQFSNNISITENIFSNVIAAISQTWVGEVIIDNNSFDNINLFYGVDEYSYLANNNIDLDIDSFGNYVQLSFTIDVAPTPSFIAIGWFSNFSVGCMDINASNYSSEAIIDDGSCEYLILGDINEDGIIDILDIILTVNIIMDGEYNELADVNEDSILDILDIVTMINWIIN